MNRYYEDDPGAGMLIDNEDGDWVKYEDFELERAEFLRQIAELSTKLGNATAEIANRDAWHKARMSEDCPTDEKHCTCVPGLKRRLAELTKEFELGKCPGVRDCKDYVGMEMKLYKRIEDLKSENACADALELLWKEIIIARNPDYGEWEYPGQAYRHLKAEFDEQEKKIERAVFRAKTAEDSAQRWKAERDAEHREAEANGARAVKMEDLLDAATRDKVIDREDLGRKVREIWIAWAAEQSPPNPDWHVPWEYISEREREVDRRIGEGIAQLVLQREDRKT